MTREYRVYGPPGTGKTTWLAAQAKRAAQTYGSDAVMIASFTKAAAEEISGRDISVDREHVGTLHALCYRALGAPEIAETHVREWNDHAPELALSVKSASDLDDPYADEATEPDGDALLAEYNRYRAMCRPITTSPDQFVRMFATRWEAWKSEHGYWDFTDLIAHGPETPPGMPRVGFFDEVQDSTALELARMRTWAQHMESVVLAGDDDQCIYTFRGAEPSAFLTPDLTPEQKRVLAQSYRVPRAVHAYASRWIASVDEREPKEYAPRDAAGSVDWCSGRWVSPESVVEDARSHLNDGQSVMILASCSYMLRPTLAVLRQEAIPFANRYRRRRKDWNPLASGTVDRVLAYLRPDPDTWGEHAREWNAVDMHLWGAMVRAAGVLKRGAKAEISALNPGEPVTAAMLSRWFEDDALLAAYDLDTTWLAQHVTSEYADRLAYAIHVQQTHGGATLRAEPLLTVGTIHSVKGGEADYVYVFPDLSMSGAAEWDGEGHDAVRRLFYVALTRAREGVVLCAPSSRRAVRWESHDE